MAGIIKIPVTQISGTYFAPDNSITVPRIKHLDTGAFYSGAVIGTTGIYKFTNGGAGCPDGYYVFFDNATELPNILGSTAEGGTWYGDGALGYLPLVGSDYDAGSKKIINVADPTTATGALNRQFGDGRYIALTDLAALITETELTAAFAALLAANKLIFPQMTDGALDQNIYATWTFRDAGAIPYILATPTSPFHAATVKFVKDYVNNYLTGNITFQQTETIIIIDFDCTQEDNRRYFSITGAIAVANAYADVGTRVTLYVEGGNIDNLIADGNLAYMLFPETAADYVDLVGMSQGVWVTLSDTAYSTATVGKKVIQNITLSNPGSSSTTFSKYIFRNVKFIGAAGSSNIAFTDCIFENCSKDSTVTVTYIGACLGEILDISNSQKLIFNTVKDSGGAYEIAYANGDIRGKRILGRQGTDVASANNITLTEGNAFTITGNTQVNLISSTGWTAGSVITLQFSGTPTVKHLFTPSGVYKSINWKSGADRVMVAGAVYMLVLSWDTTYWSEV